MKLNNPRVLTTTSFSVTSLSNVENSYFMTLHHRAHEHAGEHWYRWDKLLNNHNCRYEKFEIPTFKVCVVTYDVPTIFQSHGLDRRNALRLLNGLGMEAPSSVHAFVLAEWMLNTPHFSLLPDPDQGIDERRGIVCPTPIHPEFPEYFLFDLGRKKGFYKQVYTGYGKEPRFCFFRYDHGGVFRRDKDQALIFPLVIGVKST